ncbi:fad synthase [Malassezia pachydermatis]|uniref:FAD synthase n=1 Tax=Malassezia pachydermatis TaxID=77020 RepID=A0A0N0RRY2_9BASI|nr:fad synthase [Malassezia pachydermatis]KOS12703.1 fad synthase [Malassezia pachydermatis]
MPGGPSSAWLHSIDATYELVEVPEVREKYPVLAQKVAATITACEEALRDYGWHHCALSFNGGKDCTVLAHILTAVLRRLNGCESHQSVPTIESLYVACSQPFTEVEQFIEYAASEETGYHLILHTTKGDLKTALTEYKEGEKGKDITAIFIGVRRDDPQGSTIHVRSKCDPSWPPIMRIHPLLDWEYEDVWAFLRCPHLRVGATSSHVPSTA